MQQQKLSRTSIIIFEASMIKIKQHGKNFNAKFFWPTDNTYYYQVHTVDMGWQKCMFYWRAFLFQFEFPFRGLLQCNFIHCISIYASTCVCLYVGMIFGMCRSCVYVCVKGWILLHVWRHRYSRTGKVYRVLELSQLTFVHFNRTTVTLTGHLHV